MSKTCIECKNDLPYESFYPKRTRISKISAAANYGSRCKSCESNRSKQRVKSETDDERRIRLETQRKWWFRSRYGITVEEFDQMVDIQGGKCACCQREPQGKGAAAVLNVDHDHVTGRVRGLLCNPCNQAMGLMKDNPSMIRQLLRYAYYAAEIRVVA